MDQGRIRSQQEFPQGAGDDKSGEYYHHYHHHRSHHHDRCSQPGDETSGGAGVLPKNISDQTGMSHSTLKAQAIMTADSILAAGVAKKENLADLSHTATGKQPVYGLINFEQTPQGVHITGQIEGLGHGTSHGFHVHEFGDVSSGCTTTGAHFNPFNHAHGGLNDAQRHVGDLGNVTADAHGVVHVNILNPMMFLHSEHSIVGRAIVIHAMPDDLGRGGNEESTKTGNSGARLACGIIGLTNPMPT